MLGGHICVLSVAVDQTLGHEFRRTFISERTHWFCPEWAMLLTQSVVTKSKERWVYVAFSFREIHFTLRPFSGRGYIQSASHQELSIFVVKTWPTNFCLGESCSQGLLSSCWLCKVKSPIVRTRTQQRSQPRREAPVFWNASLAWFHKWDLTRGSEVLEKIVWFTVG